ncbi:MAG TPA: VOC family protein [Steroidobacteraceae bacterium]|nr:VOC family protein [Steroidobacteraceae bacterium]
MKLRIFAVLSLLALSAVVRADSGAAGPVVAAIDSIGITVDDMDRAVDFYTKVLGFEKLDTREVAGEQYEHLYGVFGLRLAITTLRLGGERIELMQFVAPRGRPEPADSKSNDRWFQHIAIIVSDMDRAYAWLREHKVEHASSGPQLLPAWNPNAGGIAAFYFRDPDGNHLEVLHFPEGKGDPKWHRQSERLFLGIDHTAIVVADTDQSLGFYRDALGLRVAGASENFGPEQERLNNVFGARLRITALRATRGPGVELLEYLAPRTGRPMPVDSKANDDWYWQVNTSAAVAAADGAVRHGHYTYISPGPQAVEGDSQLIVRDPDGHALLLRDHSPTVSTSP